MEEFGITAVEAQAAGRPVIAAAAGGALETVLDGVTGRLAALGDVEAFRAAIEGVDSLGLDPAEAVRNAERFSVAAFRRRIAEQVGLALERRKAMQDGAPGGAPGYPS
jgi:glycosyltransferase involved in cell wall biosynthesis